MYIVYIYTCIYTHTCIYIYIYIYIYIGLTLPLSTHTGGHGCGLCWLGLEFGTTVTKVCSNASFSTYTGDRFPV